MRKILFFLCAFLLIGSMGIAQSVDKQKRVNENEKMIQKARSVSSELKNVHNFGQERFNKTLPTRNTIFTESFETGSGNSLPTGWTTVNNGHSGNGWVRMSGFSTDPYPGWAWPDGGYGAGSLYNGSATVPRDAWMISPQIPLVAATDYNISFWLEQPGYPDWAEYDFFEVFIADGNTVSDLSAGTTVYYNVSTYVPQWILVQFSFTAPTTDDYYLGFHIFSPTGEGDYLVVDLIEVAEVSNDPLISIPGTVAFGSVYNNVPAVYENAVSINNMGGSPLTVSLTSASAEVSITGLPVTIPATSSATIDVLLDNQALPLGAYAGNFVLATNDPLNPSVNVNVTATATAAVVSNLIEEDFEGISSMPPGWNVFGYEPGISTDGGVGNSQCFKTNAWGGTPQAGAATPFVIMGDDPVMSFWFKCHNYGGSTPTPSNYLAFGVFVTDDYGANWTLIDGPHLNVSNAAMIQHIVDVSAYAGETCRFEIQFAVNNSSTDSDIYIDDVLIGTVPSVIDLTAVSVTGNAGTSVGTTETYTVNVKNSSYSDTMNPGDYDVKLWLVNTGADIQLGIETGVVILPQETLPFTFTWTPSVAGPFELYGEVICATDVNPADNISPIFNVTVKPAGLIVVEIKEEDYLESSVIQIPLDLFYRKSLSQSIYYPSEINAISSTIYSLTYDSDIATANIPDKQVKVWMGEITDANLAGSWVSPSLLTEVFDGFLSFPQGRHDVEIPLTTPYEYNGGNLVIYIYKYDSGYHSSSDRFYRTRIANSTRSLAYRVDGTSGTELTFENPSAYTASVIHGYSNISLEMNVDGLGKFEGIVDDGTNPLDDVTIEIDGTPFAPVTDATGYYISAYLEPDTYTLTVSKLGYQTLTTTVVVTANSIATKDITLALVPAYNISGTVTASDGSGPLDNVAITITGEMNASTTTDIDGEYELLNIWDGYTYTLTAQLAGWQSYTTEIEVDGTDITHNIQLTLLPVVSGIVTASDGSGPLDNVAITLGSYSATTDITGYYEITDVINDVTYTLTAQLAGWQNYTAQIEVEGTDVTHNIVLLENAYPVLNVTAVEDNADVLIEWDANPLRGWESYTVYRVTAGQEWDELGTTTTTDYTDADWSTLPTGVYRWAVVANYTNDVDSDPVLSNSLYVNIDPIDIGTGTILNNEVPVNLYWRKSMSQTLYYPSELGTNGGEIAELIYYSDIATTNIPEKRIRVWMGETTQMTLNTTTGWIAPATLTEVFDGFVAFPAGVHDVNLTLDTPFQYNGDNLVVYIYKYDGAYHTTNDRFVQTAGANRSIYYRADGTTGVEFDFINPPTASNHGNFANITFMFNMDGMGELTGVVTDGTNPVDGATVAIEGLTFDKETDINGEYTFPYLTPGSYDITVSKLGYYDTNVSVVITADATTVENIVLVPLPEVTVSGYVLTSDTNAPIDAITVTFTGFHGTYTGTSDITGYYDILNVYGDVDYTVTAVAPAGYQNFSALVSVPATNFTYDVIIAENAYPVINVEATIAGDDVFVDWCPMGSTETWVTHAASMTSLAAVGLNAAGVMEVNTRFQPADLVAKGVLVGQEILKLEYAAGSDMANITYMSLRIYEGGTSVTDAGTMVYEQVIPDPHLLEGIVSFDLATPWAIDPTQELRIGFYAEASGAFYPAGRNPSATGLTGKGLIYRTSAAGAWTDGSSSFGNLCMSAYSSDCDKNSRAHESYAVYRLLEGEELNETSWDELETGYTTTNYLDTDWNTLDWGVYKYAVKAEYTNGVISEPTFSNKVDNDMYVEFEVNLVAGSEEDVAGAVVTLTNKNNIVTSSDYVLIADNTGVVTFPAVWRGIYDLRVKLLGFEVHYENDLDITEAGSINIMLYDYAMPASNAFAVINGHSAEITWDAPLQYDEVLYQLDDGTDEQGIGMAATSNASWGNLFVTTDEGLVTGVEVLFGLNGAANPNKSLTIEFYNENRVKYAESAPFFPKVGWNFIPVDNVPFTGDFYAMVRYQSVFGGTTNWLQCDATGPNAAASLGWMVNGASWTEIHTNFSPAIAPVVCMIRPYVLVEESTKGQYHNKVEFAEEIAIPDASFELFYAAIDLDGTPASIATPYFMPKSNKTIDRSLDGFKIYRFEEFEPEIDWVEIGTATTNSYTDATWHQLLEGTYQYGVKALYSGDNLSDAAISNSLLKELSEYIITVTANPVAGNTVSGGGTYTQGDPVTVVATPEADVYEFVNWTKDGAEVSTSATYSFTAVEDVDLIANFVLIGYYQLQLTVSPANSGTVTGEGDYLEDEVVPITATANTALGYGFVNWTDGATVVSTTANFNYTMPAAHKILTANFALNSYTITVTANPVAGGTVSGDGTYNHGTPVTVVADANEGWNFVNWTKDGSEVSTSATYTFNATENADLVANFVAEGLFTLQLVANPTAGAEELIGAGSYAEGTEVPVNAIAAAAYNFVNWTDGATVVSTTAAFTYEMPDANKTLTANFAIKTYTITVSKVGNGTITPSDDVTINHGEDQMFTFEPDNEWKIAEVLIDGTNNPGAVTNGNYEFVNVTSNRSIEVKFEYDGGINSVASSKLSVYPNPANDVLYISSEARINAVSLYDATGRLVLEYEKVGKSEFTLNLSNLSSGVYFVNIDGTTVKVVKK